MQKQPIDFDWVWGIFVVLFLLSLFVEIFRRISKKKDKDDKKLLGR
jgi:hypothetical protein